MTPPDRSRRDAVECVCAELVAAGCVIQPEQLAEACQEIKRMEATDRARAFEGLRADQAKLEASRKVHKHKAGHAFVECEDPDGCPSCNHAACHYTENPPIGYPVCGSLRWCGRPRSEHSEASRRVQEHRG